MPPATQPVAGFAPAPTALTFPRHRACPVQNGHRLSHASLQFYSNEPVTLFPRPRGTPAPATVRWRLIAGNRRDIGRSAHLFADIDQGRAALVAFRSNLSRASQRLELDLTAAQWRWRILVDDEVVVASTRGYARRVECQINLAHFTELVPHVTVDPQLRAFTFDRRRGNRGEDVRVLASTSARAC